MTRNRTKGKICNFRKRDFQFAKQESVWNSTARKYERVYYKPQSCQKKSPTTAKPQKKKIQPEPKTACKAVKTDKCSHSSSQNPNRSDTVLTNFSHAILFRNGVTQSNYSSNTHMVIDA